MTIITGELRKDQLKVLIQSLSVLLIMRSFSDIFIEKLKKNLTEICEVYEIMLYNILCPDRPQMAVWHM